MKLIWIFLCAVSAYSVIQSSVDLEKHGSGRNGSGNFDQSNLNLSGYGLPSVAKKVPAFPVGEQAAEKLALEKAVANAVNLPTLGPDMASMGKDFVRFNIFFECVKDFWTVLQQNNFLSSVIDPANFSKLYENFSIGLISAFNAHKITIKIIDCVHLSDELCALSNQLHNMYRNMLLLYQHLNLNQQEYHNSNDRYANNNIIIDLVRKLKLKNAEWVKLRLCMEPHEFSAQLYEKIEKQFFDQCIQLLSQYFL